MSVALRLYEQLTKAGEDKIRGKVIADVFEQLEKCYPHLRDLATQDHVGESELHLPREIKETEGRLTLEIGVRLEVKEAISKIRKEIKGVEGKLQKEIREVESRLQHEIAHVRLEIKAVDIKNAETKAQLVRRVVALGLLQTSLFTGVL